MAAYHSIRRPRRAAFCTHGISLVELLVTIGIIAIVLGLVIAVFSRLHKVVDGFRPAPPQTTKPG